MACWAACNTRLRPETFIIFVDFLCSNYEDFLKILGLSMLIRFTIYNTVYVCKVVYVCTEGISNFLSNSKPQNGR